MCKCTVLPNGNHSCKQMEYKVVYASCALTNFMLEYPFPSPVTPCERPKPDHPKTFNKPLVLHPSSPPKAFP